MNINFVHIDLKQILQFRDINTIINDLIGFHADYTRERKLDEENIRNIDSISSDINHVLPPKPNEPRDLYNLDLVVYYKFSVLVQSTYKYSAEERNYVVENCFEPFHSFYINQRDHKSKMLDRTYIKLMAHSSVELFRTINNRYKPNLLGFVSSLIKSRNGLNLVRAIKLLAMAARFQLEVIKEQIIQDPEKAVTLLLWLSNLTCMPEPEYSETKFIASWLTEHVTLILNELDLKRMEFPSIDAHSAVVKYIGEFYPLKEENFKPEFVAFMLDYCNSSPLVPLNFIFDNFIKYFLSALTEEDRLQRIQDFLKGVDMMVTSHRQAFKNIFRAFARICGMFVRKSKSYSKNLLKLMDYSYDDTPYLLKGSDCTSYHQFRVNTSEIVEQSFDNSDDSYIDEILFEFAKNCVFNDFINAVKVMDVLHTAWLMIGEFEHGQVDLTIMTEIFQPNKSLLKKYLNKLIRNPNAGTHLLWWFQFLLKQCPFLFLSEYRTTQVEDLVTMFNGFAISEESEDLLHDATDHESNVKKYIDFHNYARGTRAQRDIHEYLWQHFLDADDDDDDDDDGY